MTTAAYRITPRPAYSGHAPVREPRYLAFIRSCACIACNRRYPDAAHCGPHALSQKADDRNALPICRQHHRELHRIGPVKFQAVHGLDFPALILEHQEVYDAQPRKAA